MKGISLSPIPIGTGVGRMAVLLALILAPFVTAVAQERDEPDYDAHGELERLNEAHRESEDSTKRATGEDVSGREEWFRFQRRFPYDMIPAGARASAIREVRAQMDRLAIANKGKGTLLSANVWEQIGPYNWSGRTRSIAINPSDPKTIFIGVASGGVWRTTDGGSTWTTGFDTQSAISACAVAIDPSNLRTIYAGTGENTSNIDSYLGDGIFRSTDNGDTWENIGLTNVGAISEVYVSPRNSDVIYVAACKSGGGFYRTLDRGVTWEKTFNLSATVFDMSVNPRNPNEIFLATNASIYRSTDGGKTFQQAMNGMTLNRPVRLSVAISPSDTNIVYVLAARGSTTSSNHVGEVYRSTNGGDAWTKRSELRESFFNEQGWYDNCIAVHPTRPGVVVVGGIDTYRSTDSGATFNNVTFVYQGGTVHPDHHTLAFSPNPSTPDNLYLGTDGGVYFSAANGTNWTRITNSLPTSQYYAMDVDQSRPYRVYGGTQDNGTHGSFDATKYAQAWEHVLAGDGFFVVVDMTDPNYIYAENFNGSPLYRINATSAATINQRSQIDGGEMRNDPGYWSTPLAMSPADKKSLFSGRANLWKNSSPRSSNSWTKILVDSAFVKNASKKITAIGLSPLDVNKMIVGTNAGDVRFSLDGGDTWKASTGVPARFVTQLRYDPVDANLVYMTVSGFGSGHVFKSTNSGATFTNISSNLPDLPCSGFEVDPENPRHLFVGTDAGVFVSLEGGAYWLPFSDGLALAPVADLRIHRSTRTLVAATHGRSMFKVSIATTEARPIVLFPTGGQTFTSPGSLTIRWVGFTGRVRVLISYDGGATFDTVARDVAADSAAFQLPIVRTTKAIVKVEPVEGGGASASSGAFTISPVTNVADLGKKGFIAQALAVKGSDLWATVRGTDSIVALRLPLMTRKGAVVRSGFSGTIRDLDYDAQRGLFYALVADDDGANARIYRMDTNGVATGQVTMPVATATGIALSPETKPASLAIFSPADGGKIFVINPETGSAVSTHGPLTGATGGRRRGLVWNGNGYVQGVNERDLTAFFTGELQRIRVDGTAEVAEVVPAVIAASAGVVPVFFGLTIDPNNADAGERLYYATDTSGTILQFRAKIFSTDGVSSVPVTGRNSSDAAITTVTPNPARTTATVGIRLATRTSLKIELYTPAGDRVLAIAEGAFEAGARSIAVPLEEVPSGVYFVSIESASGDRDVRPLVVVK